jgi:hypothetical protein
MSLLNSILSKPSYDKKFWTAALTGTQLSAPHWRSTALPICNGLSTATYRRLTWFVERNIAYRQQDHNIGRLVAFSFQLFCCAINLKLSAPH